MTTRIKRGKRKRLLARLPEWEGLVRGSLIERRSECGKAGCRCHRGEPHGPYHYLSVTRGVGKTQIYNVPAEKVEQVRRGIAAYQQAVAWRRNWPRPIGKRWRLEGGDDSASRSPTRLF